MSRSLEKILKEIIRWGSFLILFVPLFIYRQSLFPYVFPKIIVFQILVEIIFIVWLFLIFYKRKYRPNFKNPIVLALTVFMIVLVVTMFTGVDASRSFWSTQERMTGILTMLHFYGWFLILSSTFKKSKDWKRFIWASLVASFLIGLYGIGQELGMKSLLRNPSGMRWSATLGNPIYLAVYAMMHVFLAVFLFLREKKYLWRGMALFLLIFNLVMMSLGASRAVLGGFGVAVILFLVYLVFILSSKRWKIGIASFLILLVLLGLFLYFQKNSAWIEKAPYSIQRLLRNPLSGIWKRTQAWKIAYKGFIERPFTGWGWENYNVVFNKFYHPRYLDYGFQQTWFDKSHNQVADIVCLTGIFGLISYLAIFGGLFGKLLKASREETPNRKATENIKSKMAIGVLGIMFIAYFLQNLFVFDTPAPLILFYFGLALIVFTTETKQSKQVSKESFKPIGNGGIVLAFFLLLVGSLAVYELNVRPFKKSHLGWQAAFAATQNSELGVELYKKTLKEPCFINAELRMQLAKSVIKAEKKEEINKEILEKIYKFTVEEFKKNLQNHPFDVRYYLTFGRLTNSAATLVEGEEKQNYLNQAQERLERAKELSPKRQEVYYRLGRTKMLQNEYDEAIKIYKRAVQLNQGLASETKAIPNWYLGMAYLSKTDYKKGIEQVEKARRLGYKLNKKEPQLLLYLAESYAEISKYEEAILICDKVLKNNSQNLDALSQKAIYLSKQNKDTQSQKIIDKISEINPTKAEQVKKIIKSNSE